MKVDDLTEFWMGTQEENPELKLVYIGICIGTCTCFKLNLSIQQSCLLYSSGGPTNLFSHLRCRFISFHLSSCFKNNIAGLTLLAGLMSGLTLGLMSMDSIDLEVLHKTNIHRWADSKIAN